MVVRSPLWIWHLGVAPCRHFTALSLVFFCFFFLCQRLLHPAEEDGLQPNTNTHTHTNKHTTTTKPPPPLVCLHRFRTREHFSMTSRSVCSLSESPHIFGALFLGPSFPRRTLFPLCSTRSIDHLHLIPHTFLSTRRIPDILVIGWHSPLDTHSLYIFSKQKPHGPFFFRWLSFMEDYTSLCIL